jgi:hypothetical protein
MPQIIIRPRSGGTGSKSTDTESQVLVIITPEQVEIYTDEDAENKLASE